MQDRSADIDNPFFPMPVGTQWILTGVEDDAPVRVVISSLVGTEVVAGVTTRASSRSVSGRMPS